jgi:hypothetical protein
MNITATASWVNGELQFATNDRTTYLSGNTRGQVSLSRRAYRFSHDGSVCKAISYQYEGGGEVRNFPPVSCQVVAGNARAR